MRMRRKKWVEPELQSAAFCIRNPQDWRGKWNTCFAREKQPLTLELGCGKGGFISQYAFMHQEENILAVDLISNVLGSCKRAIDEAYGEQEVGNIRIAAWDAERIDAVLAPEDRVEKLFINFCNPWPKAGHRKRRLTHTRQLLRYRSFLVPGAELLFKTDDPGLFLDTHTYLAESGFRILEETDDLPAAESSIITEHEEMFRAQGKPIHFLRAVMEEMPAAEENADDASGKIAAEEKDGRTE